MTLRGTLADVDLRLLRVFRAVVEHGGFAAAEVALNKSKSAISLDISGLEQRLGARLCTRGRAGFALTDAGHSVYAAARRLFADLDRFRDEVAAATERVAGRLTLAVVDNIVSVAERPLAAALGAFGRRFPDVELVVESAHAALVEQAIIEGEAELGISVLPRPLEALELTPLFREEVRLYCGRTHPLFGLDAPEAQAVRACRLVRPSVTDDPAFAAALGAWPGGARANALDARVLLILGGAWLGFLPPHYARPWVERGDLRELLPQTFRSENTFHVIARRSPPPGVAAVQLKRLLLAAFGRDEPS